MQNHLQPELKKEVPILFFACLFTVVGCITSCSKNTDGINARPDRAGTIERWAGQYCSGNGPVFLDIIVELNSDHTAKIIEGDSIAYGTWNLAGNIVITNYTFRKNNPLEYSFACIPSVDGQKLNGTWGMAKSTSGGGTILLTKQ